MITPLQRAVAQTFFELPESTGYAVAGGAALIARTLIDRATRDVDLFTVTPPTFRIPDAVVAFEQAAATRGWTTRTLQLSETFARLIVDGNGESLLVDLGIDSPPEEPPSLTELGPTLTARDLAARKTLALFGRAEPRDFTDVYDLAHLFSKDDLLSLAAAQDPGFDLQVFADMIGTITRLTDRDLQLGNADAEQLRHFFSEWREELRTDNTEQ